MILPSGYKRLEWIESTGTQYVDTGFVPNNNTKVFADVEVTGSYSANAWVLGSRNSDATARYELIYIASASAFRFYYGTSNYTFTGVAIGRLSASLSGSGATVNGVSVTPSEATFQGSNNLYICSCGGVNPSEEAISQKVYSCQIYDNDTLVRQFVPCINPDGEVGLYDTVEGKFYGNAGTGTFTAGPALYEQYQKLEYIESTGTQYIDTGFKPNQDTRVVCKAICAVSSATNWLFGARYSGSSRGFGFAASASGYYLASYNTDQTKFATSMNSDEIILVDANKASTTLTANSATESVTGTSGTFTAPVNLTLFSGNTNGTITKGSVSIYFCQIYSDNAIIRDYIPVKRLSDGAIGLLDDVGGTFYANTGTGEFVAGPEVFEGVLTPEIFEEVRAVYLRWSEVDCQGYRIYRDGELVAETTNTFYADLGTDDNETYTYTLVAYRGTVESEPVSLEVHTKTGYFLFKPLIQSAFFQ